MTDTTNPSNFIRSIIDEVNATGKYDGYVHTASRRSQNGYLHIGHAEPINLNYGLARDYGGLFNLRFGRHQPEKEEQSISTPSWKTRAGWGADWDGWLYHASDYFEQLYEWAEKLIKDGKAYVDDLSADEIREYRGTLTEPGRNSPYRDRSVEENLDLFLPHARRGVRRGSRVLRGAKIDMASPFFVLRDPVMYRILHAKHPRTGHAWHIYPTYDWAHGQSDSIEGITHSICTLEFENNRLYDWFQEALGIRRSQQNRVRPAQPDLHGRASKRKMIKLVKDGYVDDWDDPRFWTLGGFAGAATHLRPSAPSPRQSASARPTVPSTMPYWRMLSVKTSTSAPRGYGRAGPTEGRHRELPQRQGGGVRRPFFKQDKTREESRSLPSREIPSSAVTSWRNR